MKKLSQTLPGRTHPDPAEQALSIGARCANCDWVWTPEHTPTVRDLERATFWAGRHRTEHPGHVTTVSGSERSSTAQGSSIRMLALEIER